MSEQSMPSVNECPLARLSEVTHIGTLNPADKGVRGDSYEGTGLSFSLHPEEWETIARLGGAPWWTTDVSSCRLLDGHELIENWGPALAAWGEANGWLDRTVMYRIEWFDDEVDGNVSMLCASREEALAELEFCGDGGLDEDAITVVDPCWVATSKLDVAMGRAPRQKSQGDANILQDVATVWAKEQGLDGVWWEDELNVQSLSAPRGVVFEHVVPSLAFEKLRSPQIRPSFRR